MASTATDTIFANYQRFLRLNPAVDKIRRRCAGDSVFNANKFILVGREFEDNGRRSFFIVDRKDFTKKYNIGEINFYYEVKYIKIFISIFACRM